MISQIFLFENLMFVYIFDAPTDQWVESESLYLHDIALLIDTKAKKIHLWFGEKSEEKERDVATRKADEIMERYKSYEMIVLGDSVVPLKIQSEIEILLGDSSITEKLARSKPMRMMSLFGYIGIILMMFMVLNNARMLLWESEGDTLLVNKWSFNDLFQISVIIMIVVAAVFLAQFIAAAATQKIFLMACAAASFGMVIGTLFYLAEGEFIFEFQDNSTINDYVIKTLHIVMHVAWMVVMWLFTSLMTIIAIRAIKSQTEIKIVEEMDVDQMRLASRPTILRDNVVGLKEIEKNL